MNADVSRALARFVASLGLSREAARGLTAEFADVQNEADLPEWVREVEEPAEPDAIRARARELDLLGVTRAAGHDVTPGHDQLHHWWVYGEGRQRWHTWTELHDQLLEHVGPEQAKRFASEWFHERYGYWSGSDINRVKHGKPPRGDRVGPG